MPTVAIKHRHVGQRARESRHALPDEAHQRLPGRPAVLIGQREGEPGSADAGPPHVTGHELGQLAQGDEVGVRRHVDRDDRGRQRAREAELEQQRAHRRGGPQSVVLDEVVLVEVLGRHHDSRLRSDVVGRAICQGRRVERRSDRRTNHPVGPAAPRPRGTAPTPVKPPWSGRSGLRQTCDGPDWDQGREMTTTSTMAGRHARASPATPGSPGERQQREHQRTPRRTSPKARPIGDPADDRYQVASKPTEVTPNPDRPRPSEPRRNSPRRWPSNPNGVASPLENAMVSHEVASDGPSRSRARRTTSRAWRAISYSSLVGTTSTATSVASGDTNVAPEIGPSLRTSSTAMPSRSRPGERRRPGARRCAGRRRR